MHVHDHLQHHSRTSDSLRITKQKVWLCLFSVSVRVPFIALLCFQTSGLFPDDDASLSLQNIALNIGLHALRISGVSHVLFFQKVVEWDIGPLGLRIITQDRSRENNGWPRSRGGNN